MTGGLRVIVIADTHLHDSHLYDAHLHDSQTHQSPGGAYRNRRNLPAQAWDLITGCDTVLHAGDVVEAGTLSRLGAVAPTYAVLGNNDAALVGVLPLTRSLELAGVQVAMVHDSGPRSGRARRMQRRFRAADIVVFGHSHIPCDEVGEDGQILFNPGSPTTRRAQPVRTLGELVLADGHIVKRRIIDLGP